ncbi:MAG: hypothetical protein WCZ86_06270 [Desulfurivibrionaceae bacterium]
MIYTYQCVNCERVSDRDATVETRDNVQSCHFCRCTMRRVMSRPHFTMGASASKFDDVNARQKAWMDTPEVQAKLKTGEYSVG